jgi:phage-related tail fiber protein
MGTVPRVCRNVKRCRKAAMAQRRTAAGMMESAPTPQGAQAAGANLRTALAAHQAKHTLEENLQAA